MNSATIASTLRSRRSWLVLQLAAGVLVGGIALFWAIRGLDASVVLSEVQHAEYGWIIVAFLCTILVAFIKVERWRTLYPIGDQPVPFSEAFSALLVTQMVNVIVPIRGGEMVRIGLMKQSGQPGATTLSTITVEKTLDLVAAALVAASLVVLAVAPDWLQRWSGSALVLGFVLLGGIVAMWALREPLTRMVERLLAFRGWLPERWRTRLTRIFRTMLDAFGVLTTRRTLVRVLVWTLLVWVFSPLAMFVLFIAFDLNLPFAAAIDFDARNYVQQYCAFVSRAHRHCASDCDCGAGRIRCEPVGCARTRHRPECGRRCATGCNGRHRVVDACG